MLCRGYALLDFPWSTRLLSAVLLSEVKESAHIGTSLKFCVIARSNRICLRVSDKSIRVKTTKAMTDWFIYCWLIDAQRGEATKLLRDEVRQIRGYFCPPGGFLARSEISTCGRKAALVSHTRHPQHWWHPRPRIVPASSAGQGARNRARKTTRLTSNRT